MPVAAVVVARRRPDAAGAGGGTGVIVEEFQFGKAEVAEVVPALEVPADGVQDEAPEGVGAGVGEVEAAGLAVDPGVLVRPAGEERPRDAVVRGEEAPRRRAPLGRSGVPGIRTEDVAVGADRFRDFQLPLCS